jgi:hypothetical protein
MRQGSSSIFINAFPDLSQHVSANYCHYQGVVVPSEAIQTVCIVDVYGLRPAWLHPSRTDHSGRAVIHIHPQYRLLK